MEYDLSVYVKAAVQGVPLLFVVLGLVWFWGKLGVSGWAKLVSSMATGLVVGVGYMMAVTPIPAGDWWVHYGYWFSNCIYGTGLGLIASGFYEVTKELIAKALAVQKIGK